MGSLVHGYAENSKQRLLSDCLSRQYEEDDERSRCLCLKVVGETIKKTWNDSQDFARKAFEMGRSDPSKVIFALKMGVALSVVSLLIFLKGSTEDIDVGQYSIWAILTVIVMFEFSVGATLIKGFNRALGTLCAGILAFGFAEISVLAGHFEEVVIVISIFITGFCASYLKLYPTMKPYEYGFRVFILTYCILMVAGNRTREYNEVVLTRMVLIVVGAGVCFLVNVCIYPIWAGEALHSLVVKDFKDLATSLEGCVNGYLRSHKLKRTLSRIVTHQASDDSLCNGYRSVVESTGQEETLLGFATWEPPHGRYRVFKYPWRNFVEVSGALRHCAFTVMALHGCILSEIQAPAELRQVFHGELKKVGDESAKVLREVGNKLQKMEKLSSCDGLKGVHEAAEELQKKIDKRSYLLVNSESWEIGRRPLEMEDPENGLQTNSHEKTDLGFKSLSETVLDLRSLPGWTGSPPKKASWPSGISYNADSVVKEGERRTYESASALSLATFASLLIELVARLQNVVDSFEELSEKADFEDPGFGPPMARNRGGLWVRLCKCFRVKA